MNDDDDKARRRKKEKTVGVIEGPGVFCGVFGPSYTGPPVGGALFRRTSWPGGAPLPRRGVFHEPMLHHAPSSAFCLSTAANLSRRKVVIFFSAPGGNAAPNKRKCVIGKHDHDLEKLDFSGRGAAVFGGERVGGGGVLGATGCPRATLSWPTVTCYMLPEGRYRGQRQKVQVEIGECVFNLNSELSAAVERRTHNERGTPKKRRKKNVKE
ncbi:hypothetical protein GEV33_008434 [Tenebrio molitor]|uniref:Uncharacterized protein n=1 Tax=Tenebrio molitor TaxID=7067 RepID=A0A8J6LBJ0_TENMO|nr:hypothetical protein GEV33_008434 [Tenebrio molitor]